MVDVIVIVDEASMLMTDLTIMTSDWADSCQQWYD